MTVESGAFTVTSTIGGSDTASTSGAAALSSNNGEKEKPRVNAPCPRFGSAMTVRQGVAYVFGGMLEDGDVTYTLQDMYCIGKGSFTLLVISDSDT